MAQINLPIEIEMQIQSGAALALSISGGKDSRAMANGAECIHTHQLKFVQREFKKHNR